VSTTNNATPKLATNIPYYMRAWLISVTLLNTGEKITLADSRWTPESLRVTFETELVYATQAISWCEIEIYNPNLTTQGVLLNFGDTVTVSAGYQVGFSEQNNVIWQGQIFQATFERRDVINFVVHLHCLCGLTDLVQNLFTGNVPPRTAITTVVRRMAAEAQNQITLSYLSPKLDAQSTLLPRGQAFAGKPADIAGRVAANARMVSYFDNTGLHIAPLGTTDANQVPDIIYGPSFPNNVTKQISNGNAASYTPTLLGTPQQTQNGVSFDVLMDSRVQIGKIIALDFSVIKLLPIYPNGQVNRLLTTDGTYAVVGIRHTGDTYVAEAPWRTSIDAVALSFWPTYVKTYATT